jgi:hypothetical protein
MREFECPFTGIIASLGFALSSTNLLKFTSIFQLIINHQKMVGNSKACCHRDYHNTMNKLRLNGYSTKCIVDCRYRYYITRIDDTYNMNRGRGYEYDSL